MSASGITHSQKRRRSYAGSRFCGNGNSRRDSTISQRCRGQSDLALSHGMVEQPLVALTPESHEPTPWDSMIGVSLFKMPPSLPVDGKILLRRIACHTHLVRAR